MIVQPQRSARSFRLKPPGEAANISVVFGWAAQRPAETVPQGAVLPMTLPEIDGCQRAIRQSRASKPPRNPRRGPRP
jgi:hypothetical protein